MKKNSLKSKEASKAPKSCLDKKAIWVGILVGLAYGLLARLAFNTPKFQTFFTIISFSFILLIPIALGFLSVYITERKHALNWSQRVFVAVVPALLCLVAALVLAWEGWICIALWLPLFFVLAGLGGAFAGAFRPKPNSSTSQLKSAAVIGVVALLPFLASPLEQQWKLPQDFRIVHNQIEIAAAPEVIWEEIKSVPKIKEREHSRALNQIIGFPKPVEATLQGTGVGAIRHARFEGNVVFIETITEWDEPRKLSFSIHADPNTIPAKSLDEHVTVGGPYFDVLDGTYMIEPIDENNTRLHLWSTHRLSTRFNFYSHLWTDWIMGDIQKYILEIIKRRAEENSIDTNNQRLRELASPFFLYLNSKKPFV